MPTMTHAWWGRARHAMSNSRGTLTSAILEEAWEAIDRMYNSRKSTLRKIYTLYPASHQVLFRQMSVSQLCASQQETDLLLEQPTIRAILQKRSQPRHGRLDVEYLVAFEGYPDEEADWYPAKLIRNKYEGGEHIIKGFEAYLGALRAASGTRAAKPLLFAPFTQEQFTQAGATQSQDEDFGLTALFADKPTESPLLSGAQTREPAKASMRDPRLRVLDDGNPGPSNVRQGTGKGREDSDTSTETRHKQAAPSLPGPQLVDQVAAAAADQEALSESDIDDFYDPFDPMAAVPGQPMMPAHARGEVQQAVQAQPFGNALGIGIRGAEMEIAGEIRGLVEPEAAGPGKEAETPSRAAEHPARGPAGVQLSPLLPAPVLNGSTSEEPGMQPSSSLSRGRDAEGMRPGAAPRVLPKSLKEGFLWSPEHAAGWQQQDAIVPGPSRSLLEVDREHGAKAEAGGEKRQSLPPPSPESKRPRTSHTTAPGDSPQCFPSPAPKASSSRGLTALLSALEQRPAVQEQSPPDPWGVWTSTLAKASQMAAAKAHTAAVQSSAQLPQPVLPPAPQLVHSAGAGNVGNGQRSGGQGGSEDPAWDVWRKTMEKTMETLTQKHANGKNLQEGQVASTQRQPRESKTEDPAPGRQKAGQPQPERLVSSQPLERTMTGSGAAIGHQEEMVAAVPVGGPSQAAKLRTAKQQATKTSMHHDRLEQLARTADSLSDGDSEPQVSGQCKRQEAESQQPPNGNSTMDVLAQAAGMALNVCSPQQPAGPAKSPARPKDSPVALATGVLVEEPHRLPSTRGKQAVHKDEDDDKEEDKDEEEDEDEESGLRQLIRQHLTPGAWEGAKIIGACLGSGSLDLHVVWDDGFDAWIVNTQLKSQPHCLLKLCNYYESKTKRPSKQLV